MADMMEVYSRQVVCETLVKEILSVCADNGRVLKDLTCLYAFLIAGMHARTGIQVSV